MPNSRSRRIISIAIAFAMIVAMGLNALSHRNNPLITPHGATAVWGDTASMLAELRHGHRHGDQTDSGDVDQPRGHYLTDHSHETPYLADIDAHVMPEYWDALPTLVSNTHRQRPTDGIERPPRA